MMTAHIKPMARYIWTIRRIFLDERSKWAPYSQSTPMMINSWARNSATTAR